MHPEKLWTIVEEHRFASELARLIDDGPRKAQRADEFVDGAKWVLARNPHKGHRIGDTHVWFIPNETIVDVLPVVIYYTFNENHVYLLSIQETTYPIKE